jgi:hypothetical protein
MENSGWRDERWAGGGAIEAVSLRRRQTKEDASEDTSVAKKNVETEKAKDRPRQSTACLEKEAM